MEKSRETAELPTEFNKNTKTSKTWMRRHPFSISGRTRTLMLDTAVKGEIGRHLNRSEKEKDLNKRRERERWRGPFWHACQKGKKKKSVEERY